MMLYCFILYISAGSILYYMRLYYITTSYYAILLYYMISYCVESFYISTVQYYTIPYYTILCYGILYYAIPCHAHCVHSPSILEYGLTYCRLSPSLLHSQPKGVRRIEQLIKSSIPGFSHQLSDSGTSTTDEVGLQSGRTSAKSSQYFWDYQHCTAKHPKYPPNLTGCSTYKPKKTQCKMNPEAYRKLNNQNP